MDRHETLAKISHYEWMLETMTLRPAHEFWILDQLEDLRESVAKFHPENHPHHKCG
jgi:hypothetical protein